MEIISVMELKTKPPRPVLWRGAAGRLLGSCHDLTEGYVNARFTSPSIFHSVASTRSERLRIAVPFSLWLTGRNILFEPHNGPVNTDGTQYSLL